MVQVMAPLHVNALARQALGSRLLGMHVPLVPRTVRARGKVNSVIVSMLLSRNPPQVVHETYYSGNTVAPKCSRTVLTVHDMINERVPELIPRQDKTSSVKTLAVARCDHIICVSHATKKDLIDIIGVDTAKISVIYHGCSLPATNGMRTSDAAAKKPFFLFVGVRSGYKNFCRLLEAYAGSGCLSREFDLVCFGGPPFTMDEVNKIRSLRLSGKVTRVAGGDPELQARYRAASCFVYPSVYEGFGIPLLEAMSCECPIVCSNTSAFPEVAGDAAEYCDPSRTDSIETALVKVLYSESRTKELRERGRKRVAQFSWDQCARETLQVYSSLV